MNGTLLGRSVYFLFFLFLIIGGLYFAKPFLVPVCIAGLLAMLFLPLQKWFAKKHFGTVGSILACVLILVAFFGLIAFLLSWEIQNLAKDTVRLQEQVVHTIERLKFFIKNTFGITAASQEQMIREQGNSIKSGSGGILLNVIGSLGTIAIQGILVIVYLFLFLYLREHLKKFILMLVPEKERENTRVIIRDASGVGQKYILGLSMMIFLLWIFYGIGFSIIGVKYALFFAILCGLLELVPFVGNFTGVCLTVIMSISQGAGNSLIIGIIITYCIVQFIQTYFLEPLVVGAEVNLNPLFTIMALVVGELIWGIAGMILALPLLGILKIVCDHIPALQPYGFLIGRQKKKAIPLWKQFFQKTSRA